jgi:hypothetical protein
MLTLNITTFLVKEFMDSWNYRILAFKHPRRPNSIYFECRTVYYTDDVPNAFTAEPAVLYGLNKKSLRWELNALKEAMSKPILWGEEGKFPRKYKRLKKKVE